MKDQHFIDLIRAGEVEAGLAGLREKYGFEVTRVAYAESLHHPFRPGTKATIKDIEDSVWRELVKHVADHNIKNVKKWLGQMVREKRYRVMNRGYADERTILS